MKKLLILALISSSYVFADGYTIQEPMGSVVKSVWEKSGFKGINIPKETATGKAIEITHINMVGVCDLKSKQDVELAMKLFASESSVKTVRGPYGVYERGSEGAMKFSALNSASQPSAEAPQKQKPVCKNITVEI
jgi:hypothetical protein